MASTCGDGGCGGKKCHDQGGRCGSVGPDCGPVEEDCPGGNCAVTEDCDGNIIPNPGVCAPGPWNVPNTDAELMGSLGMCLQPVVDSIRDLVHDFGLRGYRVCLVWQRRNSKQRAVELLRKQLHPVLVSSTTSVNWQDSLSGMYDSGELTISQISPAQVKGPELFGEVPEFDWYLDPDIEFFYEVKVRARCPGDNVAIRPWRFTPSSEPYYDAENFQWVINVMAQIGERTPPPPVGVADRDGSYQTERVTNQRRTGRRRTSLRT